MNTNTNQDLKASQERSREVRETVYPLLRYSSIEILYNITKVQRDFCIKYAVRPLGFEILIKMAKVWNDTGAGVGVYVLADSKTSRVTATAETVTTLLQKGLVEVVGFGSHKQRLFAPSRKTLLELGAIAEELGAAS